MRGLARSWLVSVSVARELVTQCASVRVSSHSLTNLENKYQAQHVIHVSENDDVH